MRVEMDIGESLKVEGDVLVLKIGILVQVKIGQTGLQLFLGLHDRVVPHRSSRDSRSRSGAFAPLHSPESGHGSQKVYFEVGLGRKIFHNAGNFKWDLFFEVQGFSYSRFISKVPLGCTFG